MVDDPSRATAAILQFPARSTTPSQPAPREKDHELENVEFLDASLSNPTNLLMLKLKEVQELPEDTVVRRVLILTEYVSEDGRGIDVCWSESDEEPFYVVQDSVVSMLTRVKSALTEG